MERARCYPSLATKRNETDHSVQSLVIHMIQINLTTNKILEGLIFLSAIFLRRVVFAFRCTTSVSRNYPKQSWDKQSPTYLQYNLHIAHSSSFSIYYETKPCLIIVSRQDDIFSKLPFSTAPETTPVPHKGHARDFIEVCKRAACTSVCPVLFVYIPVAHLLGAAQPSGQSQKCWRGHGAPPSLERFWMARICWNSPTCWTSACTVYNHQSLLQMNYCMLRALFTATLNAEWQSEAFKLPRPRITSS